MGNYTSGPRARNNTKRLRRTAVWFAALWPASMQPGFSGTWRTHGQQGRHRLRWRATYGLALALASLPTALTPNRWGRSCRVRPFALPPWSWGRGAHGKKSERRPAGYKVQGWRRHLGEGVLAAAIVMLISTLVAFSTIRPGEAGTPQGDMMQAHAHRGASEDRHAPSLGGDQPRLHASRYGAGTQGGQGGQGGGASFPHDLDTTLVSDHSDDREGELRGPGDGIGPGYSPTLTHFYGGGGGGGVGSGGGGSGHADDGSPQGSGPSQGEPGGPEQHSDPTSPFPAASPDHPARPPIVDPDPDHHPQTPVYPQAPPSPILSAVPEPHTWLMMILGFSVIGGALRQHRGSKTSSCPRFNV